MRQLLGGDLFVRDAEPGDLATVVDIYNSTIPGRLSTADLEPVSVESRQPWFQQHAPARRPLWVATVDQGPVIGWLSFQDFYGRPAYAPTAELSIYIAEGQRGQGLGSRLLSLAIDTAPEFGVKNLLAIVFGHNEASLRLFRGREFVTWGLLPKVCLLAGVERDTVILGRRL
ncbi:MAG: GNAT family N-acetyltransferase [Chloroflexota bacterium]